MEKLQRKINRLLVDYEYRYAEMPFYRNTEMCTIEGAMDELKSINTHEIEEGEIGCYIRGRIKALEKLHNVYFRGDKNE